jgi:Arc/MetJ-type ribon-helix-helix transcriptional regulator
MTSIEYLEPKQISIRLSAETEVRAQQLIEKFPDDYANMSDVIRAGIMSLYVWKMSYVGSKRKEKIRCSD